MLDEASCITSESDKSQKTLTQETSSEKEPFYSSGAAIKIKGSAPVGSKANVRYDLSSHLLPGEYTLSVHYLDENDGHSPVNIYIGNQVF